ncbi:MAG TPA: Holliday junction resolvase RuvX [Kouleothrix sp.]|uniref:Holliday junction resolvase RuvX n=1 Tax=Kouleothrix sp. TaxID=2779161 RepID=UPI002B82E50C|nr:Holliday junction resolvase RuvX [Kouleothrix sp.]HRC75576.1 Holliday junction resolvase RuvX [Kouleothrix sp.]
MSDERGRVMALDVGGRRIGVALSDTRRVLASPLTTLRAEPRERALAEVAKLVREYEVCELVVGLPLTLSGEVGPQARLIQQFAEQLQAQLAVPVRMFDERLTTVAAERMMVDLGMKPEQRKARIDEVAASIILQDFLDSIRERTDHDL